MIGYTAEPGGHPEPMGEDVEVGKLAPALEEVLRRQGQSVLQASPRRSPRRSTPDDQLRAEITGYAKEHLAKYKYPRRIELVDSLPLGPSGKVLKRELVEQFRGQ